MGQVNKSVAVNGTATVTPAEFGQPAGSTLGNPTAETDGSAVEVSGLTADELEATGLTAGGSSTITIPVTRPDGTTDSCTFTVSVTGGGGVCNAQTLNLTVGGATGTIDTQALSNNAALQPAGSSSNDNSVATVAGTTVTPVAAGTTTIDIAFANNGVVVGACPVTVVVAPDGGGGGGCTPVSLAVASDGSNTATATPADFGFPGGSLGNPGGETNPTAVQVSGLTADEIEFTGLADGVSVISIAITSAAGTVETCDVTVTSSGGGAGGCVNQDGFVLVGDSRTVTPADLGFAGMEFDRFAITQSNAAATNSTIATTSITATGAAVGTNTYTVPIVNPADGSAVATCSFAVEVRSNDPCSGIPGAAGPVECGQSVAVSITLPTGATGLNVTDASSSGATISGLANTGGNNWRFNYTAPACDGNEPKTLLVSVDFTLADGTASTCDDINIRVNPVTVNDSCSLSDGTNEATAANPKVTATGGGAKTFTNSSAVDGTLFQTGGTATLVASTGAAMPAGGTFSVTLPNDGSTYAFELKCGAGC